MIARTGEVVDQSVQDLVRPTATDDRDVVGDGDVATILPRAGAGPAVGRVRVIDPAAAVGVRLRSGQQISAPVRGVGGSDRVDTEDRVGEVDEALDLLVAVGGRAANELDRVGVAHDERHRPAGGDRDAVQTHLGLEVAALGDETLDIDLAGGGSTDWVGLGGVDGNVCSGGWCRTRRRFG